MAIWRAKGVSAPKEGITPHHDNVVGKCVKIISLTEKAGEDGFHPDHETKMKGHVADIVTAINRAENSMHRDIAAAKNPVDFEAIEAKLDSMHTNIKDVAKRLKDLHEGSSDVEREGITRVLDDLKIAESRMEDVKDLYKKVKPGN